MLHLEDLGERRLEECGAHADQGNDPHPEDRAGTTHEEGGGHTEHVADTHARGQRNREGLEGGNAAVCTFARPQDGADHLREEAHLHEKGTSRQEQAHPDQDVNRHVQRDPVGDGLFKQGELFHRNLPGCLSTRPWLRRGASRTSRDTPARCNGTRSSCHRASRPAGDVSPRAWPHSCAFPAPASSMSCGKGPAVRGRRRRRGLGQ